MQVFTGDQYSISISLWLIENGQKRKGTPLDFSDVEVIFGPFSKTYAEGGVSFDEESQDWIFFFTQQESFQFQAKEQLTARVKIGNNIEGINLGVINVAEINSRRVL